jgi:hypothetical protein
MSSAKLTARNIIEVIDTRNLERHVAISFNEGQISAYVIDTRQIDKTPIVHARESAADE